MSTKFGGAFLAFPRWVLPYLNGDSVAKAVLLELLVYMKPETQSTTTSYKYIAEQVGCDRRTVMRAISRLESTGVLIRRRRGNNGHNLTNRFIINFNNPEALRAEESEVVSPMTLGSDTHVTTSGVTHDTTPSVTSVTQIRTNNKNSNKSSHNKRPTEGYEDIQVDARMMS
jgi:biotin operon repressor